VTDGSKRAIIAAFLANLGIAIAKFIGFVITGSAGMLAEAVHSCADTGNQALLMLGGRRAAKRASAEHPFGYGRERYFWAFAVAMVLFSMGGLFALYEGFEKLRHPHEVESIWVGVTILLIAIALESWSLRTAVKETNHIKPKAMGWFRFIRTSKQPELPVVLLEDTGAEIGLLFALCGLLLAHWTGDGRWDALGSVAIGLLLIAIAITLMIEMMGLLIGEAASAADIDAIDAAIRRSPHVEDVIHMRTEHLGPDEILLATKVEYDSKLTFDEVADAINVTEANIRGAVPAARMIYIEPDFKRPVGGD
jgi:cation diffusion facilitator family transporter